MNNPFSHGDMTVQDKALYNITLALAGIAQAATLVKDLAQTGKFNETAYEISINSIFQMDPPNVLAVYGGDLSGLKFGLEALITLLNPKTVLTQTRYLLGLMRLQKKFLTPAK